jgi:2-methylcitrate dehydratase PrpD
MMRFLEILMMLAAAGTVLGYICRLDPLRFGRHQLRVIAMHVALLACAAAAGFSAWSGHVGLQDVAGLVAAASWLWISLPTWRHGPPSHVTKAERIPRAGRSSIWGRP